jgi:hypothetical protein
MVNHIIAQLESRQLLIDHDGCDCAGGLPILGLPGSRFN